MTLTLTLTSHPHPGDNWQPLIWAAKDGNLIISEQLLDNGHDINKTEPVADKGSSAWAPVHWASSKGHIKVLEMLIKRGANVTIKDKHGGTAKTIAEKKGLKEVVVMLEAAESGAKPSAPANAAKPSASANASKASAPANAAKGSLSAKGGKS